MVIVNDQVADNWCCYQAGEGEEIGNVVYLLMSRFVEFQCSLKSCSKLSGC
jgi:hypothetical protein